MIGLFGLLFCVIVYLVCGWYRGKWKTSHEDLTALEENSERTMRNPCFDYDRYRERAIDRELAEVRGFKRERINIRNRSLAEYNLGHRQHVVLIPPNVESSESTESNQNLIQDSTVSSTTNDDNQLQTVNLRLWSFFRSLF